MKTKQSVALVILLGSILIPTILGILTHPLATLAVWALIIASTVFSWALITMIDYTIDRNLGRK